MKIIKDKEIVAKRLAEIAGRNGGSLTPDLVVKDDNLTFIVQT